MRQLPETLIILFCTIVLFIVFSTDTANSINYLTVFYDRFLKTIAGIILLSIIALCTYFIYKGKNIFSNPSVKNVFTNAALVILSITVMLLVAEFLFSNFPSTIMFSEFSTELHHQNKPNFSGELIQPEWKMNVRTNSLGLRGEEIPPKQASKKRILLLGDSFTFGYGVQEDETFSRVVEERLGSEFEVINAGTISYSPLLEYLQLKKIFDQVQPDIVIMNFDMSDVQDDYKYEKESVQKNGEILFNQPEPGTGFSLIGLAKNSKIISLLKTSILDPLVLALPLKPLIETDLPAVGKIESDRYAITRENPNLDEHWQRSFNYIKKTAEYVSSKKAKFMLHAYPYGHQVNAKEWDYGRYFWGLKRGVVYSTKPFEKLENFSKENQITFINSLPRIKQASAEEKLYYDYDGHFNRQGHLVLGEFLAKQIIEKA